MRARFLSFFIFERRWLHGWCQKAAAASKERETHRAASKYPFMDNLQFFEKTFLDALEGRLPLIVTEYHSNVSIVRIHDEYCLKDTEHCLKNASAIVSSFYKRRQLDNEKKYVAAMQGNKSTKQKKLT